MRSIGAASVALMVLALWPMSRAIAQGEIPVSLDDALRAAREASPDLVVARARQSVARAEVGIAGTYVNPTFAVGSSTQAARFSATVSIPLLVLGQRGAAMDAARADESTVALDALVTWNEVRQSTVRAYVALWLAQGMVVARREVAAIAATLEAAVVQRVLVGAAPELDGLRVHAEKLQADADVVEALADATVSGSELGRWMGVGDGDALRATSELPLPGATPDLSTLRARLGVSASLRREQSDVLASEARVTRERALVRPAMSLDLGVDAFDPTLLPPDAPPGAQPPLNYRGQLVVDVPIFNQRGAYIERERAQGEVARARVRAVRLLGEAELTAAYRTFEAATAQQRALAESVVPAARAAAQGTEEAYALGRAQLLMVLDAERALLGSRVEALRAQAARANAWADVEHALGAP